MMLTTVLAAALFLFSTADKTCFDVLGTQYVNSLIQKLQKHPPSKCNCSTNVTDCLCLPVPSDNCTMPCFQDGLSRLTNVTTERNLNLNFNWVKKRVEVLHRKNCQTFSCKQPCTQTTEDNTLAFLKRLLETFQKENIRSRV
ncbi:PREDICTED: interleukin-9 [Chrysochloris asiatica]|uniref:Interleukin-9 n=1 Tax=Chrysochloris asiatica TaxID=185453 RepID=A0A9B0TLW5_CHRAS|nr:PREDICTED: interleukin-9 [Chrysochloris asiatica]